VFTQLKTAIDLFPPQDKSARWTSDFRLGRKIFADTNACSFHMFGNGCSHRAKMAVVPIAFEKFCDCQLKQCRRSQRVCSFQNFNPRFKLAGQSPADAITGRDCFRD
jgi:hypothetical protein